MAKSGMEMLLSAAGIDKDQIMNSIASFGTMAAEVKVRQERIENMLLNLQESLVSLHHKVDLLVLETMPKLPGDLILPDDFVLEEPYNFEQQLKEATTSLSSITG